MSRAALGGGRTRACCPLDAATQVAIPEFDGRIIGGAICFKERDDADSPVGVAVPRYVADPERCDRLAGLVVRHARLRDAPAPAGADRDRADRLPDQARADRHGGRPRHARQRDRAAATRCSDDGIDVDATSRRDGDALMHALIAAGGHDPEFLTDEHLAAAPLRIPVADYLRWYATLPAALRDVDGASSGARRRATATSTATTS